MRVCKASAEDQLAAELMDCMLEARAALWKQYLRLYDQVAKIVTRNALCRPIAIRSIGPISDQPEPTSASWYCMDRYATLSSIRTDIRAFRVMRSSVMLDELQLMGCL